MSDLTLQQVAEELNVSLRSVQRLVKQAKLEHYRATPNSARVTRKALDEYKERMTIKCTEIQNPSIGTHRTPSQAAKELEELLGRPIGKKKK